MKAGLAVKKKLLFFMFLLHFVLAFLLFRVFQIQAFDAELLQQRAYEQQTRDRLITPNRGSIFDRNMVGIGLTETVASVSVIRSQIKEPEMVAQVLSERLSLDYDVVLAKIKKRVALERIQTKVDKSVADDIRRLNLAGVVVDEDVLRVYPYATLAAQVIGFVGKDNQGIVGLEAKYDSYLKGEVGKILTETDARGIEMAQGDIVRTPPKDGESLVTTLDVVIQQYAEQTIAKAVSAKDAKRGVIIVMNPQNGEIYAMANEPTFDLNEPFTINSEELQALWPTFTQKEQTDYLNQMWRNFAINDTYEPGSTFKIMTSAAGIEEGVVTDGSHYTCNGYHVVGGRQIKCWRYPRSHGTLNFMEGIQNSCNPVFMTIAEQLGAETFYKYMDLFGFKQKTGIDLPGEAVGIMHKLENVGPVELATMSFGQSFQISPLQLLRATAATVNGGFLVTPHIGTKLVNAEGIVVKEFNYDQGEQIISKETSDIMKTALESVVEVGTGNKSYIPGYRIGGKTATSEKLPRRSGKYIASFLTIAPAENPTLLALVLIDEPKGAYYGGQVAGPVMKELLENTLPYLGVEPIYSEEELAMTGVAQVVMPDVLDQTAKAAKKTLETLKLKVEIKGEGNDVLKQFPPRGELLNQNTRVVIEVGTKAAPAENADTPK